MGVQLEWQALAFVCLNHPSFLQHVTGNDMVRPSLISRLKFEIECLRVLLSEKIVDF